MMMLIILPETLEKSQKFKKTDFNKIIPSPKCGSCYELSIGPNIISIV